MRIFYYFSPLWPNIRRSAAGIATSPAFGFSLNYQVCIRSCYELLFLTTAEQKEQNIKTRMSAGQHLVLTKQKVYRHQNNDLTSFMQSNRNTQGTQAIAVNIKNTQILGDFQGIHSTIWLAAETLEHGDTFFCFFTEGVREAKRFFFKQYYW